MTDAYQCDRCGEFDAIQPALKVAATGSVAGNVRTKADIIGKPPGIPDHLQLKGNARGSKTKTTSTEINGGDLCEVCAEKFEEWWNDD